MNSNWKKGKADSRGVSILTDENESEYNHFKKQHAEQLKLVSDFTWIDFDSLDDVEELITDTLSIEEAEEYLDESQIKAITESVCQCINVLKQISLTWEKVHMDSIDEDIARTYS